MKHIAIVIFYIQLFLFKKNSLFVKNDHFDEGRIMIFLLHTFFQTKVCFYWQLWKLLNEVNLKKLIIK